MWNRTLGWGVVALTLVMVVCATSFAGRGGSKGKPGGGGDDPPPELGFTYEIQYLGMLPGGSWSFAQAINASGEVVGNAETGDGEGHAFYWDPATETMTDLNDLVDPAEGWFLWEAVDINDAGQIVGTGSWTPDSGTVPYEYWAYRFTPDADGDGYGTVQPLAWGSAHARAINNEGDVVGMYSQSGWHGFLFTDDDGLVDLGTQVWLAKDISDRNVDGEVMILSNDGLNNGVDSRGLVTVLEPGNIPAAYPQWTDLGFVWENRRNKGFSTVWAINADWTIVGLTTASKSGYTPARYTFAAGWELLTALPYSDFPENKSGEARGINALGEIVGWSYLDDDSPAAFIYSDPYGMRDLTALVGNLPLGARELQPVDINDDGLICGPREGLPTAISGKEAYILTPIATAE